MKAIFTTVLLPILCMGQQSAWAAAVQPPGLYRVDMDSTMSFAGKPGEMQVVTNGSNGDTDQRWREGERSAARQYKGNAPVTACIKPAQASVPPGALKSCTGQSSSQSGDTTVHSATCPMGRITITIRQLDKDRWEYLTDVAMVQGGARSDFSGIEMILKHQAQHGATEQDRARAREQLAALPRMQKERDAGRAEVIADAQEELREATDPAEKAALQKTLDSLAPGAPTMQAHSRAIWTRLAATCPAGK